MLTHIDLFSGIGGFALAAGWCGIRTIAFCEIDPFCQKVLRKNFGKDIYIHEDIKTFTNARCERQKKRKKQAEGFEQRNEASPKPKSGESRKQTEPEGRENIGGGNSEVFLITGGFPCQPFSQAGKRKGTEDDRHLWPEMLRVIKEFKPTWVIGENVAGIRSMELCNSDSAMEGHSDFQEDGENDYTNVMDGVCNDLEAIGYEVQPIIIPACAIGAPHRRDRVWFIANYNGTGNGTPTGGADGNRKKKDEGREGFPQSEYSGQNSHAPDTINEGCIGGSSRSNKNTNGIQESKQTGDRSRSAITRCDEVDSYAPATSRNAERAGQQGGPYRPWQEEHGGAGAGGDWLTVATRLCRMDDGVSEELYKLETSDRVARLKALGNAIVPQVAYEIIKKIVEVNTNENLSDM